MIKNNTVSRKLKANAAETLTETLVSVLIISIVSVAFAVLIRSASHINQTARDFDIKLDQAIKNMSRISDTDYAFEVKVVCDKTQIVDETFNAPINGSQDVQLYIYDYRVS